MNEVNTCVLCRNTRLRKTVFPEREICNVKKFRDVLGSLSAGRYEAMGVDASWRKRRTRSTRVPSRSCSFDHVYTTTLCRRFDSVSKFYNEVKKIKIKENRQVFKSLTVFEVQN